MASMADIFVSYTSSDRDWAFWIGKELQKLGHTPHILEWEIQAGGNIAAWMEERYDKADHILFVVSQTYLTRPYSAWERQAAEWAAPSERPNFALPVFVENCLAPSLLMPFKRCKLYDRDEAGARAALTAYLTPAAAPAGDVRFPRKAKPAESPPLAPETASFPGKRSELPNAGLEKAGA